MTKRINYDEDTNTSTLIIDNYEVANLNFNSGDLEVDDLDAELDLDEIYDELYRDRDEYYDLQSSLRDHQGFINFNFYNLY